MFSVGQFSLTGPNHPNEDRAIFSPKAFTDDKGVEVRVYGTIDGHGGSFIADYVTTHLLEKILRKDKFIDIASMSDDDVVKAIQDGFHSCDIAAIKRARKQKDWSGACCIVVIIMNGKMFVANLGDCRAVRFSWSKGKFKSKPKALSNDHQPLLDRERIEKAGGWIDPDGRVLGVISCSRSFGDREFKYQEDRDLLKSQRKIDLLKKAKKEAEKQNNQMFGKKILTNIVDKLVISVPEVKIFPIAESDGLLLIATDGVWDYLAHSKAQTLLSKHFKAGLSLDETAKKICEYCRTAGSGLNVDDITCLLVTLQDIGVQ